MVKSASIKSSGAYRLDVFYRVLIAAFGGYALSGSISILLSYLLTLPTDDAIATASMFAFIIYTAAILWVFHASSWQRALAYVSGITLFVTVVSALIMFYEVKQ